MAYNKAREEHKWKKWKEHEEEKLRELGMNEASIQALHESDWADFNSDRRFQEHQTSLLDYMEFLLAESEAGEPEIRNVEELLNSHRTWPEAEQMISWNASSVTSFPCITSINR